MIILAEIDPKMTPNWAQIDPKLAPIYTPYLLPYIL